MAYETVALFRRVDVFCEGTGTLYFYTDLPGGAWAERAVFPLATASRLPTRCLLPPAAQGRLYKIRVVPEAASTLALFRIRVWAKILGKGPTTWQWFECPVVPSPEQWTRIPLPIAPTPEEYTRIALPIQPTPEQFTRVPLPIPETPEQFSRIAMPIPETPENWSRVELPIDPTPDRFSKLRLPIKPAPDEWTWRPLPVAEED